MRLSELLEHPLMHLGAKMMSYVILFLYLAVGVTLAAIYTPPAHAKGQKKELKHAVPQNAEPVPFDPERARLECVKKRSVKKCELLVELLQNLDDIKKKAAVQQQ